MPGKRSGSGGQPQHTSTLGRFWNWAGRGSLDPRAGAFLQDMNRSGNWLKGLYAPIDPPRQGYWPPGVNTLQSIDAQAGGYVGFRPSTVGLAWAAMLGDENAKRAMQTEARKAESDRVGTALMTGAMGVGALEGSSMRPLNQAEEMAAQRHIVPIAQSARSPFLSGAQYSLKNPALARRKAARATVRAMREAQAKQEMIARAMGVNESFLFDPFVSSASMRIPRLDRFEVRARRHFSNPLQQHAYAMHARRLHEISLQSAALTAAHGRVGEKIGNKLHEKALDFSKENLPDTATHSLHTEGDKQVEGGEQAALDNPPSHKQIVRQAQIAAVVHARRQAVRARAHRGVR